jgi:transcriptional regulator with XRE-family HTH domain
MTNASNTQATVEPLENLFGRSLKVWRCERHLSQSKLAKLVGCDHSTIARLENGSRNPGREMVESLAVVLRLDAVQTATLLLAAGYAPCELINLLSRDQRLAEALLRFSLIADTPGGRLRLHSFQLEPLVLIQ